MKTMRATVYVSLPDDEFAEAAVKLKVKPVWDKFLADLKDSEVEYSSKLETTWARTRPTAGIAPKRGRSRRRSTAAKEVEAGASAQAPLALEVPEHENEKQNVDVEWPVDGDKVRQ
jgi:hypothetical protein